jgi:hypothetical protein
MIYYEILNRELEVRTTIFHFAEIFSNLPEIKSDFYAN